MDVKNTFGILKGWWRIILKIVNMRLRHVSNLVTTCICLHNLYIIHKNNFDLNWTKKGERLMQRRSSERIGQLDKSIIFMAAVEAANKIRHLLGLEEGIIHIKTLNEPDDINDQNTQETIETKK